MRRPARSTKMAHVLRATVTLAVLGCGCSRLSLDDPGGGGGGGTPGPPPALRQHPVISLVSAVGGPSRALVGWEAHAVPAELPSFALFVGPDPGTLYGQAPASVDPPGASAILAGLQDGAVLHVGLAVRASSSDPWTPSGPILRVRTGAPIYVDFAAPAGGDGTSPATATNDLPLAILDAFFVHGGGNVWVKAGDLGPVTLPLYGGVFLSGGFGDGMLLEERDPALHPTRLEGAVNEPLIQIQAGSGPSVLDGFVLDGREEASAGVDDPGLPCELRSLVIRDCRRGIVLAAPSGGAAVPVLVSGARVREISVQGLRLEGPHDLWIESSEFRECRDEGVALGDLIAPEAGSASLVVRASNFVRNGAEGIDAHLAAPPSAGNGAGRFQVLVQDCDFQENALAGLNVDMDTEAFPAWAARIEIRGCTARANGLAGVHLDLDSTSTALLHRVASSANGAEGIHVSSESWPGMATVSCSAVLANDGVGVRGVFGQVGLALSHCVLSGNGGGGLASEVAPSAAASSIAYLQAAPWSDELAAACPEQATGLPEPFLRAARELVGITGLSGGIVHLASMPLLPLDGPAEVDDDGVARGVLSLSGTNLALDPTPSGIALPGIAGFFGPGTDVEEDFRLAPGSIAAGTGLSAPLAPPVDAGTFGSPAGGAPGRESAVPAQLFRLASTSPAWTQPLAPQADLLLAFESGNPDPASVASGVFVVDAQGNVLGATASASGALVRVSPPPGGWENGQVLEVFPALRSTDGRALAIPLALPVRVP